MIIHASASPGEVRVAVVGSQLEDYAIWRSGAPGGVGDVYRGRVTARVPAMAGAFVAIAGQDGFLPDSAGGASVTDGMILGVRVTRAAQGGKGPRLAAEPVVDGVPGLLRRGPNAVERLATRYPDAPIRIDDSALAACLPAMRERIRIGSGFDDALEAAVEELGSSVVDMPGGARLRIWPTPALVAIDVDLGMAGAVRGGKSAVQMAVNTALLPALARQIRLRNLGGAIMVDLGGLTPKRRAALGPALSSALAADPLGPRFLGFTALGLAEIVRPRVEAPLHELLAGPHAAALAALRTAARQVAVPPHRLPRLHAAPAVAAALRGDRTASDDLARRAGRDLIVVTDATLAPVGWRLENGNVG